LRVNVPEKVFPARAHDDVLADVGRADRIAVLIPADCKMIELVAQRLDLLPDSQAKATGDRRT
jgi:hypothetical protein